MDIGDQLDNLMLSDDNSRGSLNTFASADKYVNDSSIEHMWAMKAHQHAEVYMKLLASFDCKKIKLTKFDEIIHQMFLKSFKDIDIEELDEERFKSKGFKEKWRRFCDEFKGKITDYNMGALIRKDVKKIYSEENSMLVSRIQFLAIEITRNKQGLNNIHSTQ